MRKKMKRTITMVLSFALTGVVLTGCGESKQSYQDTQKKEISQSIMQETQQDTTVNQAETEETGKNNQIMPEYKDNFEVDSKAAEEFAKKVKVAVADKDLEALATLTAFPVYVGLPDAGVVKTKEDFLKLDAEIVFTEELLKSIEMADIENFQPSMAGFSISDGGTCNINFGVVDGILAISGINY